MIKKFFIALSIVFFSTAVFAIEAPDALVKRTAEDVLAIVKSDRDIQAGNHAKIFALTEEKVLPNFNFVRVSRLVLGKNWTRATPEQRTNFQKEFRTLLLRTYATALSKYQDQTIEFLPLRMVDDAKTASVKTKIIQSGGQPIAVDYSLAREEDAWKVYDIVIEGVSLVTNYRGQFSQEVRKNGLDSLIVKLTNKNASAMTR
ncbi:MAG: phospholipid transport system substrate-binding protein [Methylophilaceae bacterium]|jgi:phospholipid transport system substrate-binding protein|tara:strand:+ start:26438 stop:27043 length:606 start_codon:yes stop_codon:yes gene_type:complete